MPPPVRRKTFVLFVALGAVLALASVAYAGNGGFAPPTPHSPNAQRINDSYDLDFDFHRRDLRARRRRADRRSSSSTAVAAAHAPPKVRRFTAPPGWS